MSFNSTEARVWTSNLLEIVAEDPEKAMKKIMGLGRTDLEICFSVLLETLARSVRLAQEEIRDLDAKIRWFLEYTNSWSEDGTFTFPDGDIWRKDQ